MPVTVIVCVAAVICALTVLISMKKSGRFFSALLLSVLEGTAALFAVNAAGTFTSVSLNVNWLTLASGAVFGVPGIAANIIANIIIR